MSSDQLQTTLSKHKKMKQNLYTKPLQQKPTHKQWRAYLLRETGQSNIRANRPNKALPDIPSCSATRVGGWESSCNFCRHTSHSVATRTYRSNSCATTDYNKRICRSRLGERAGVLPNPTELGTPTHYRQRDYSSVHTYFWGEWGTQARTNCIA